jgi:hypothetical protein
VPVVRGFDINLPPGKVAPLRTPADRLHSMPGAVSGQPCRASMDTALAELYSRMDRKRYCLIGTGGVFDGAAAYRKIRLGASLVQFSPHWSILSSAQPAPTRAARRNTRRE